MSSETPDHIENATFSGAELAAELSTPQAERPGLPETIGREEIRAQLPEVGGTEIILQRHGEYIRDPHDPRAGSLTAESAQEQLQRGQSFITDLVTGLPEDQRDSFDVMIVASDTQYKNGGRRSFETAQAVQEGMSAALAEAGLSQDHILNTVNPVRTPGGSLAVGGPRATPSLREPQMLYNQEFNDFLAETYGPQTRQYWIAFEEDRHAEERVAMGAEGRPVEGPDDIADRMVYTLDILRRYSGVYHAAHPGRRLIIWAATHYDTISPLVKLKLAGGNKEDALGVDYGGGITIDITPDGEATSTIAGTEYEVPSGLRG